MKGRQVRVEVRSADLSALAAGQNLSIEVVAENDHKRIFIHYIN